MSEFVNCWCFKYTGIIIDNITGGILSMVVGRNIDRRIIYGITDSVVGLPGTDTT